MTHVNQCCYEEKFHTYLEDLPEEFRESSRGKIIVKRYKETMMIACNFCNEIDSESKRYTRWFVKEYLQEKPCHSNCLAKFGTFIEGFKLSCRAIKFLIRYDKHIDYLKHYDLSLFYCAHCDEDAPGYIADILDDNDRCHQHRTQCDHCDAIREENWKECAAAYQPVHYPPEDLKTAHQLGSSKQAESFEPETIEIKKEE